MQSRIKNDLKRLSEESLLRKPRELSALGAKIEIQGKAYLNFASNDYLNLSRRPEILAAAREALELHGSATGSARLLSGTSSLHAELEREFADFLGTEASVLFSAGYLANLGAVSTFAKRKDVIFADKLVHASLIDACALSRAKLVRYRHNDLEHLRDLLKAENSVRGSESEFVILSDTVFSMDGDLADLAGLGKIAKEFNTQLIVDEAHALGVFGECGRGLVSAQGLELAVFLRSGTFSKAFASYGGIVACSSEAQDYLYSKARSFIFNTSLPASVIASSLAALKIIKSEPNLGSQLLAHAKYFVDELTWRGVNVLCKDSQIVPVLVGSSEQALILSEKLMDHGIFAPAIRPPTVPEGEARIRFSITLGHSLEELGRTAEAVAKFHSN